MDEENDCEERSTTQGWGCQTCTFKNTCNVLMCSMCGSRKAEDGCVSTPVEDIVVIDQTIEEPPLINTLRSERSIVSVEAMEVEEDESLMQIEAIDAFLGSDQWETKVMHFVREHSALFDPLCSQTDAFSHGQYEIWGKYKIFIEFVLDGTLDKVGGTVESFSEACMARIEILGYGEGVRQETAVKIEKELRAYADFRDFVKMMFVHQSQLQCYMEHASTLDEVDDSEIGGTERCPICSALKRSSSSDRCYVCSRRYSDPAQEEVLLLNTSPTASDSRDACVSETIAESPSPASACGGNRSRSCSPTIRKKRSVRERTTRIRKAIVSMISQRRTDSAMEVSRNWTRKAGMIELTVHNILASSKKQTSEALEICDDYCAVIAPLMEESLRGIAAYLCSLNILCRALLVIPGTKERVLRTAKKALKIAVTHFAPTTETIRNVDDDGDDGGSTVRSRSRKEEENETEDENDVGEDEPPDELCCPITCELFQNPVEVADGHIYERAAIEEWLEMHETSPMTNLKLEHKTITPASAMLEAVKEFLGAQSRRKLGEESATKEKDATKSASMTTTQTNTTERSMMLWTCSRCTLRNTASESHCGACECPRPVNAASLCPEGRQQYAASLLCAYASAKRCGDDALSSKCASSLDRLRHVEKYKSDGRRLRLRLQRIIKCHERGAEESKRQDGTEVERDARTLASLRPILWQFDTPFIRQSASKKSSSKTSVRAWLEAARSS